MQTNHSMTDQERKGLLNEAANIIKRSYRRANKFGMPQIVGQDFVMFYKIPRSIRFEAQRLVMRGMI